MLCVFASSLTATLSTEYVVFIRRYIFNWYLTLMDAEENAENEVMFTWLGDELQAAKDRGQQVNYNQHRPM